MLDWFSETMLKIVTSVPALFVAEDSPTFTAVRAMFELILIVPVAYAIAMRPFRSAIARAYGEGVQSVRAEGAKMMPAC
jgi:hypothetical protein